MHFISKKSNKSDKEGNFNLQEMLLDSDYNALNVSRSRKQSVKSPNGTKNFEKAVGEILAVEHSLASPLPEDDQLDVDDDLEPEIDYEEFEQK